MADSVVWERNARATLARQGLEESDDGVFRKPGLVARILRDEHVLTGYEGGIGFIEPERETYQIAYERVS